MFSAICSQAQGQYKLHSIAVKGVLFTERITEELDVTS